MTWLSRFEPARGCRGCGRVSVKHRGLEKQQQGQGLSGRARAVDVVATLAAKSRAAVAVLAGLRCQRRADGAGGGRTGVVAGHRVVPR